ncbi:ABC transporter permease [Salipiger abyssi]|uniref:ABC transporter permease n=1 Tax=Salipiger abyssi TaxID=1250539 RepID=UPI004057E844
MSSESTTDPISARGATGLSASGRRAAACAGLLLATVAAALFLNSVDWARDYPAAWELPLAAKITRFFEWLGYEADFGLFTFREATRALSWLLQQPLDLTEALLVGDAGEGGWLLPLPWITVLGAFALAGVLLGGPRLGALLAGSCAFLAGFGMWEPAMHTLALVLVIVPLSVLAGTAAGLVLFASRRLERGLTPVLDVMQSTPHFAYLAPIVVLFGFGQVPALIATVIFAAPPMIRCTLIGLRSVPSELIEAGAIAGCTRWQMLAKIRFPAAAPTLLLGVNQVIMQTLAMVVIASLIGAAGLGHNLLIALNSLRLGAALELGAAIVVLAVALDRLSLAASRYDPFRRGETVRRRRLLMIGAGMLAASLAAAWLFDGLRSFPPEQAVSTAAFWDALVIRISDAWYEELRALKTVLLVYLFIPVRDTLQWLPWPVVIALTAALGYRVGGAGLALTVALLAAFPLVTGFWVETMTTLYMIGMAVIASIVIGFPLGLLASRSDAGSRAILLLCDTLQTFPSFVYLIPVVMLFKVGDVAAITAVIAYATVPMIRYTNLGLRRVSPQTKEAAEAIGCSRTQRLWKVELPLALPEIMLGLNQTILMGLFMVAIAALVGTKDLGQQISRALSDGDTGRGLIAGLCIACLGIIADRILRSMSRRRSAALGLTG